ncbi:putative dioxygenase [Oceanicola granulosus HTCC2516]|uniref:Putative dioxygenase n=1 Tax=Oceanicola granulosus (strain ATCC BAA-861 / DSM 15982 / KCTC 12143 / HTCC2516) TaxID=314256 RepID=Q2CJ67_OCEGH|nr:phytanoyl-CoA dioxygenase family protein [Oceanicola granulosus]EAR52733.1 putative dioxygenase [Oceanicola granulosus HTCC2516]
MTPDLDTLASDFRRDGYLAVRPLFDAARIAEINQELERYIAEVMPMMPPEEVYFEDRADRGTLKQMQKLGEYDAYFRDLFETGPVRDLATAALGEEAVPKNLQYFNKPAGIGQPTPPHQDGYYFHLTPCRAVTGWLALEPVDEENGCIHYVRGSHRAEGFRPHGRSNVLGFSQGITDFGTPGDTAGTVAFAGGAGTFLLHDARTVHWAGPNRSPTRSRRALGFVYFGASARVDEAAKAAYQARLNAELKAGDKI